MPRQSTPPESGPAMTSLPPPAASRTRKLKLYVWEGAFADYYPGMAVALAYDVRQARRLMIKKYSGTARDSEYARAEVAGQPQVIRLDTARPQAWQVSGGG